MARITAECEARIKQSIDIVDLLGRYIDIRRAGTAWKACCPFHQEKTPSFHVNPSRQSYHCFGCGEGGDGIKFLMSFENLSYPDALRRIADLNGIPILEEEESPEVARRRQMRRRIVELNAFATEYYHRQLCRHPDAAHVRAYLKKRDINIEMARAWKLGWAPAHFDELARLAAEAQYPRQLLVDAYLLGQGQRGHYPVFRDRLMFPITNVRGEIVGFSGRVMDEQQDPRKYVNTAETLAFRKSELLFGLNKATSRIGREDMTVLLCEGQIDVLACHEKADLRHAVAALGTAFTDEHAAMLRKYAKRVVLCYDGDKAGLAAAEKSYRKLAAAGLEVYQAALPLGEDPDSLINKEGADSLRAIVSDARPYLEYRCTQELAQLGNNALHKAELMSHMSELLADITDESHRDIALVDVATRAHMGIELLRDKVSDIIQARKKQPERSRERGPDREEQDALMTTPAVAPCRLHPSLRGIIQLGLINAEAQQGLLARIEDLYEAIQTLEGGVILLRFFEQLPEPGNAEHWQRYLSSLTPAQAAAIQSMDRHLESLDKPHEQVTLACEKVIRALLLQKLDTLKSQLYDPHLSAELRQEHLQEITRLKQMLDS